MATKKTVVKKNTDDVANAKRTNKRQSNDAESRNMSVFEKMATRFTPKVTEVTLCDGVTVNVRNRISLGEMVMVVRQIINACVNEERGEVYFELFDFATKIAICSVYCGELVPQNNEVGYLATVGDDGMYNKIMPYVDADQIRNIWDSAKERLSEKSKMFAGAAAKITIDMLQKLNSLYDMMSDVAGEFDENDVNGALKNIISIMDKKQ